ncbi:MAG: VOC family protein [Deltaproteobacteria bacterium]|jgi:catechol 2,3-dioxygenase-like lactoylglutathione lyase family enzyme|nr:VOC family protein [Deltaproteobacteria bacterium]MBT6433216.1 VOC family protein [Deltaproteobacteria bacterium]MBT6492154.1 VOC family protein [Deltaproteobacteria bacterium]
MNVNAVHHVAIKAWDVEVLSAFYQEVLGLVFEREFKDDFGLRSVWLRFGTGRLMIERSEEGGVTNRSFGSDPIGYHLVAFSIEPAEREAWRQRLESAGCPVIEETEHTLYFQDPESNRCGLSTWPA